MTRCLCQHMSLHPSCLLHLHVLHHSFILCCNLLTRCWRTCSYDPSTGTAWRLATGSTVSLYTLHGNMSLVAPIVTLVAEPVRCLSSACAALVDDYIHKYGSMFLHDIGREVYTTAVADDLSHLAGPPLVRASGRHSCTVVQLTGMHARSRHACVQGYMHSSGQMETLQQLTADYLP